MNTKETDKTKSETSKQSPFPQSTCCASLLYRGWIKDDCSDYALKAEHWSDGKIHIIDEYDPNSIKNLHNRKI